MACSLAPWLRTMMHWPRTVTDSPTHVQAVDAAVQQPPGAAADAQLAGVLQLAARQGQDGWALRTRFITAQLAAHNLPAGVDLTQHSSHLRQQVPKAAAALQVGLWACASVISEVQ